METTPQKGDSLKSLVALWGVAARELAAGCCTSITLDYKKLKSRVENEGLSFLTITLPAFGKDFERSLDQGRVDSNQFVGFSRRSDGPLPKFLGGFLCRIFDSSTGCLLDNPCVDSIFAVRQLTLLIGKISLECSDARKRNAAIEYVRCDKEVEEAAERTTAQSREDFRRIAALLYRDVFCDLDKSLNEMTLIPKHGPGKTADGLTGNRKYDLKQWTHRLERVFPYREYAIASERLFDPTFEWGRAHMDRVNFLEPGAEPPVKVVFVPKTLKTPRVIAIEPTHMQYMQQALMHELVSCLEGTKSRKRFPFRSMIGFEDQTVNHRMALSASVNQDMATLDLSEASDRVSTQHVEDLTVNHSLSQEALLAVRTSKAAVPGKGIISLNKYASMGSAVCFPIEAMVFLTVIFVGIQKQLRRQLTRKDIKSFLGKVRVYGDDIIIPTEYVRCVIESLEAYGFKVNTSKSFWNGKFRESCGGDYYDGHDITVARVRKPLPRSRTDVDQIVSTVSLRNQMYDLGLWQTARFLDGVIRNQLVHFPIVETTSSVLGRHSVCFRPQGDAWDRQLHTPQVKGWVVRTKIPKSKIPEHSALLKYFLKRGHEPFADKEHFTRQGRAKSVDIKLKWRSPY